MKGKYSCSVIIPCFNEEDNIQETIRRVPRIGKSTEIVVVNDGSSDKTVEKANALQKKYPNLKIISYRPNRGKVHAVKTGFDAAKGDILIIWDADRTVPAKELYLFYNVLAKGIGKFANGTRMVHVMEKQAMKPLHVIANTFFGWIYSWILGNSISDTLCGTKALFKKDARKIELGKEPWGDFDLLFGAAKLGLKIIEVPVHYKMRVAGYSKMRPFRYAVRIGIMALRGILEFKIKLLAKEIFSK